MGSIILIGLGGAGLSFLHHFTRSSIRDWNLTIIDPSPNNADARTWCYWDNVDHPRYPRPDYSWSEIYTGDQRGGHVSKLVNLRYNCLPGESFRKQTLQESESLRNVEHIRASVLDIRYDTNQKVIVELDDGRKLNADWCFNSGWHPSGTTSPKVRVWQQFRGVVVEYGKDVWTANQLKLMDFNLPQFPGGVHFAYILPFSTQKALVEITSFTTIKHSSRHYDLLIDGYLNHNDSTKGLTPAFHASEEGCIPMDTQLYTPSLNPRTLNIGSISGMIKPSTGYAFTRMFNQCGKMVEALSTGGIPKPLPPTPSRLKLYDQLLLGILQNDPHQTIHIFTKLFRNVPSDLVLKFLDESTTIREEAYIFSKLPKIPFLKSLWNHVSS